MNKKHHWYDVIVAWAEGKEIQVRAHAVYSDTYEDFKGENPCFDDEYWEWRVKPTTVTKKYRMAHVKNDVYEGCTCVEVTNFPEDIDLGALGFVKWAGDIVELEIEE